MYNNLIFSGYGFVTGKHKVSNNDIDKFIDNGYLSGLDKQRIAESDNYKKAKEQNPNLTPFNYMAEYKMGFRTRYHVTPFPPRENLYKTAQSSLDLVVNAIQQALDNSGINAEEISAWMIGTATPHEMAPGIAETAKSYFTTLHNSSPTLTTTSACGGFNINIERAINFFNSHPEAKHIVVAHTEVMSRLLLEETDFVPFTTFGDGAAAVIISKVQSDTKEGLLNAVNYEDLAMVDFLGASSKGNLIMEPRRIKNRAIPNIVRCATEIMQKEEWNTNDIDLFIPHQTGNAIVLEVAEKLNIDKDKVFQEIQYDFGNLSAGSIPASMAYLHAKGELKAGMKILTSTTGLGGEMGAFSYIVPKNSNVPKSDYKCLNNKTALITGCSGGLGSLIAQNMAKKGCRVLLQYNSNTQKAEELLQSLDNQHLNHKIIQANFGESEQIDQLAEMVKSETSELNYLAHTVAVTGSLLKASEVSHEEMIKVENINHINQAKLTELLTPILTETVLFTGSIAQDAQFAGSSAYVASKRGLLGFASAYAQQQYPNLKCVFYIPAIVDTGMTNVLNDKQIQASMYAVGQTELINPNDIAERMVKLLYIPKVANVRLERKGVLTICKDGYTKF